MTSFTGDRGTTSPAGSLLTVFTPPCGGPWTQSYVSSVSSCMPPGYQVYWYDNVGYFSPAICPEGYYIACGRYTTGQGPPVQSDETAMQCAPSGYTCASYLYSYAASVSGTTTVTAPMIQIRWRSSDISKFETHPLTPGLAIVNTGTGGNDVTNTGGPNGQPTGTNNGGGGSGGGGGSSGMSPGAIAGIVIGSVVALALIALAILLMLRYRQRKLYGGPPTPATAPVPTPGYAPGQMPPPMAPTQPYYNPAYGPPPPGATPQYQAWTPPAGAPMGPPPPTTFAAAAVPGAPTPPPGAFVHGDKTVGTPTPPPQPVSVSPSLGAPPTTTSELPDHMAAKTHTPNIPIEMQGWGPGAQGPTIGTSQNGHAVAAPYSHHANGVPSVYQR